MIRTTAPAVNNKYYVSTKYGGYNRCIIINKDTGSVLPNCTGYAYGAFMEEAEQTTCNLCVGDAERWFNYADGYERGQVPRAGAVACWASGNDRDGSDGHGHVAIVTDVKPDGSIMVAQSGYYSKKFTTQTVYPPYDMNGLRFQGFIYNPFLTPNKNIKAWGVDLSQHNPDGTDLTGVDFVIIRATWGDHKDDKAEYWRAKCEQLNIPYGVYCYSYSLYPEQAREEAQYLVNTIKGWRIACGVWMDMEDADHYKEKNGVTTAEQWTDIVNAFCEVVQANDYYTGVYANLNDFTHRINAPKYDKWVAAWGTNDGTVQRDTSELGTMLQYSSYGGIDRNACYVELSHYSPKEAVYTPIEEQQGEVITMPTNNVETPNTGADYLFNISDKAYDTLKFIAKLIPLLMVFYTGIANAWNVPHTESVLATLGAIAVLLNNIADASTIGYYRSKAK